MAHLMQPKSETEIRRLGVANVREAYLKLAADYNRIIDGQYCYCHKCNGFYSKEAFYNDNRYASGVYPECKECLKEQATDYDKTTKEYVDNREKTIEVFRKLDLPFIDSLYREQLKNIQENVNEKNRSLAYFQLMIMAKTLPQYKNLHFADSDFGEGEISQSEEEINENSRIIKAARKRFGKEYSLQDLYFLETQYEDWVSRYECQTKAQEEIFERLCFKKWEINKATKNGLPTKDLDKTYTDLLSTANITPRQSGMDTFADAQTLGTLIQKWEETRPLPDIDEQLKDVDKIGLYIDAFFRGHAAKMLGLKNIFTNIYEKVMSKYTVKPPEYEDDEDSEDVFNKIFGSVDDY